MLLRAPPLCFQAVPELGVNEARGILIEHARTQDRVQDGDVAYFPVGWIAAQQQMLSPPTWFLENNLALISDSPPVSNHGRPASQTLKMYDTPIKEIRRRRMQGYMDINGGV